MKQTLKALTAALLCAALLTACGDDPADLTADLDADTTTTAAEETTAEESTDTTAEDTTTEKTTATTAETDAGSDSESDADEREDDEDDTDPDGDADEDTDDGEPQEDEPQDEEIIWDVLRVNESVAAYFENPANSGYAFEEADSCMGNGKDRVYTFADRIIMTYYENGSEILIELDITDSGIATRAGIEVGSSVADLESAYGGADDLGAYIFDTEDGTLQFMTDGGVVTLIALFE